TQSGPLQFEQTIPNSKTLFSKRLTPKSFSIKFKILSTLQHFSFNNLDLVSYYLCPNTP
ncbi:2658_t:CDS:1, partial [Racocetra fulgida]